jgi:hypothetical protein
VPEVIFDTCPFVPSDLIMTKPPGARGWELQFSWSSYRFFIGIPGIEDSNRRDLDALRSYDAWLLHSEVSTKTAILPQKSIGSTIPGRVVEYNPKSWSKRKSSKGVCL